MQGQVVVPGSNTPGIYAMRWVEDVQSGEMTVERGGVVVRGTVWIWGETIEHELGVKGEFGYPGTISEVFCERCYGWMPIAAYTTELSPPAHQSCHVIGLSTRQGRWKPAGLAELRSRAPQWFGSV